MPEYSRQGAAGPRFVPNEDIDKADGVGEQERGGRPRMQAVPRPAAAPRAGGPQRTGRPEPWPGAGRGPASGPAGPRGPEAFRPRVPRDPGQRPGPREPRAAGVPAGSAGPARLRLTGRGAVLALFVLTFVGILVSSWTGTGVVADVLFVAGCAAMAWYAKPSDLLTVSVAPPLAFFSACVLAKLITSSGGTSAAEGILVTLATSAPWLFAGTALTIAIALRRGLLGNIRELRRGLQGDPAGKAARAEERAPRR
jgi:hypothetical protein